LPKARKRRKTSPRNWRDRRVEPRKRKRGVKNGIALETHNGGERESVGKVGQTHEFTEGEKQKPPDLRGNPRGRGEKRAMWGLGEWNKSNTETGKKALSPRKRREKEGKKRQLSEKNFQKRANKKRTPNRNPNDTRTGLLRRAKKRRLR